MGVLTDAALKGDLDRVRELLAQGHNINERDEWGETPLHRAAQYNSIDVFRYLVEQGADLEAKGDSQGLFHFSNPFSQGCSKSSTSYYPAGQISVLGTLMEIRCCSRFSLRTVVQLG
jgi:ankyrin repeat protein